MFGGIAAFALLVLLQEVLVVPQVDAGAVDVVRAFAWLVAAVGALMVWAVGRSVPVVDVPEEVLDVRVLEEDGEQSSDALRALVVEEMSEGVVALDGDGRVVFANGVARRLLRLKAVPDGVPMHILAEVPRLRTTAVEAWSSKQVVVRELRLPGSDGHLIVRATPSSEGVVLVMLDVSALRRLETGWRRFVGDAAHELRTPVAAILVNLEAYVDAVGTEGRAGRLLELASRQATRLGALVEQLSTLARVDDGPPLQPRSVDLDQLVDGFIEERRSHDADSAARIAWAPGGAVAWGDAEALRRVLENLVGNAMRYSSGKVMIRAMACEGRTVIEVEDRGRGIPDEAKGVVFGRFVRLEESRARAEGGSGLGLSIVKELVDAMGGEVSLRDAVPHGTVFQVRLPSMGEGGATPG